MVANAWFATHATWADGRRLHCGATEAEAGIAVVAGAMPAIAIASRPTAPISRVLDLPYLPRRLGTLSLLLLNP